MAHQQWMRRFAKWHIWLGWLVGAPIVMWTVTGLFMVSRPIEEVRGNHLRIEAQEPPLTLSEIGPMRFKPGEVMSATLSSQNGQAVWQIVMTDGPTQRYSQDGVLLPAVTEAEARAIVAREIKGTPEITSITLFDKEPLPADFGKTMPVWQAALADGTHVYIGQETGTIEAVRTRWWRAFDFMWGLHIMDLQTREDTSHPILILFAGLGVIGSVLGCILMFRRRRKHIGVNGHAG